MSINREYEIGCMWLSVTKDGFEFFNGRISNVHLDMHYNRYRDSPKQPEFRLYITGKIAKDFEVGALWRKVTNDKQRVYWTGLINGVRVIMFENNYATLAKHPKFRFFISDPEVIGDGPKKEQPSEQPGGQSQPSSAGHLEGEQVSGEFPSEDVPF